MRQRCARAAVTVSPGLNSLASRNSPRFVAPDYRPSRFKPTANPFREYATVLYVPRKKIGGLA